VWWAAQEQVRAALCDVVGCNSLHNVMPSSTQQSDSIFDTSLYCHLHCLASLPGLVNLLLLLPLPPALPPAGKSSLIGALFRLTEIESGLITIDGVNTKALALRQLRASMALIPQVRLARRS
jgi:hypothetical protein